MRSALAIPAMLLTPLPAVACGGGFGFFITTRIATPEQVLDAHIQAASWLLVGIGCLAWSLRQDPHQERSPWGPAAFVLSSLVLWAGFAALGIHDSHGFLSTTRGIGSFPLAVQSALLYTAPLLALGALRVTGRGLVRVFWSRPETVALRPAPLPPRKEKGPRDAGAVEESAPGRVPLAWDRLLGGALTGLLGCGALWLLEQLITGRSVLLFLLPI